MLRNIAETSLVAHHELGNEGRIYQYDKIINCLKHFPKGTTRKMISYKTGIEYCSVTGRVNELVAANRLTDGPDTMKTCLSPIRAKVVRLNEGAGEG